MCTPAVAHLSVVLITLLGPVDFPFKSISMPATAPHLLMALHATELSTVTTMQLQDDTCSHPSL